MDSQYTSNITLFLITHSACSVLEQYSAIFDTNEDTWQSLQARSLLALFTCDMLLNFWWDWNSWFRLFQIRGNLFRRFISTGHVARRFHNCKVQHSVFDSSQAAESGDWVCSKRYGMTWVASPSSPVESDGFLDADVISWTNSDVGWNVNLWKSTNTSKLENGKISQCPPKRWPIFVNLYWFDLQNLQLIFPVLQQNQLFWLRYVPMPMCQTNLASLWPISYI